MCISATASRNMYLGGLIASALLLKFGIKSLNKYNLFLVGSFLYVILMQLIDYFVWIDLDCKKGTNKVAGILGSFLNYSQPFVVLLMGYLLLSKRINKNVLTLNIIYLVIFAIFLFRYYSKQEFCTKVDPATGNLQWNWTTDKLIGVVITGYILVLFINLLSFSDNNYMLMATGLIFVYLILVLLKVKNYNSVGNLWCFITPTIVILYLLLQLAFPKFCINKIDKKYLRNITSM